MAKKSVWGLCVAILVWLSTATQTHATTHPVFAYADPGSGALLLQFLTMAGLMVTFYFSRARHWLTKRLGLTHRSTEDRDAQNPDRSASED